jgi:hypothetical protein
MTSQPARRLTSADSAADRVPSLALGSQAQAALHLQWIWLDLVHTNTWLCNPMAAIKPNCRDSDYNNSMSLITI